MLAAADTAEAIEAVAKPPYGCGRMPHLRRGGILPPPSEDGFVSALAPAGRVRRGSILMETVIVMPLLLLFIFGIIQTAMIWTGKQLTVYAAYCAARAITVVRSPANVFDVQGQQEQDAAAARAARLALAWLCFFDRGEQNRIPIAGWGTIQGSGSMEDRIQVQITDRGISDTRPFVSVTVRFRMSLMMPVMGVDALMAKAADGDTTIYGGNADFFGNLSRASRGARRYLGLPYIDFEETVRFYDRLALSS